MSESARSWPTTTPRRSEMSEKPAARMDRREVLKSIGLFLGTTLSSSTLAGALAGDRVAAAGATFTPRLLSPGQVELVATIADLIIPATETPGARVAGVQEFIDLMIAEWMTPAERDHFLAGLGEVDRLARKRHGGEFVECTEPQQVELLTRLEKKALKEQEKRRKATRKRAREEGKGSGDGEEGPKPFFSHMKELTLVGYYTSEIGASEELNYVIVFDEYQGCLPVDEVGAAWS